ncbi:MAG: PP2C family protein-serine/threonine phosphatase [Bacteroidetes bacterium]|nr:PP2C family protein-serine/threonine phosphatase [Bacteroidota bacterium]
MSKNTLGRSLSVKYKDLKLNLLLEITKAINNNLSKEGLLKIFEDFLRSELNIGKLVLFSKEDDQWECILKYGVGSEYNQIDVEKYLLNISEITTIQFSSEALNKSFEIVVPVFHKTNPLAYILLGDLEEEKMQLSPAIKHLPFIQTLANIIFVAIENKKLAKENLHQVAVKKELELASEMQSMLFPSSLPNDEKMEMSAVYLPHQQVGGDYYDFIRINENEVVFCMGDVSGKGVAAALLMSNFQANLRVLLHLHKSLVDLIRELNKKVMANAKGEKFITFFIAKYNVKSRTLHYVNAGHNPPILVNGTNTMQLRMGCTGLGMLDDIMSIKEGVVHVNPRDLVICYTDGVVELEDENGGEFGIKTLNDLLLNFSSIGMGDLNKRILHELTAHKGKMPYVDDIALFSCRFK